jgi:5-methylcytosine-specific restriction endonuclease McrA
MSLWRKLFQPELEMWLGVPRSPGWRSVRSKHLSEFGSCAACGRSKNLEVHHVIPFHLDRDSELDPANLLTLCGDSCHLAFGHLFDWSSHNQSVREDANAWLAKVRSRP